MTDQKAQLAAAFKATMKRLRYIDIGDYFEDDGDESGCNPAHVLKVLQEEFARPPLDETAT